MAGAGSRGALGGAALAWPSSYRDASAHHTGAEGLPGSLAATGARLCRDAASAVPTFSPNGSSAQRRSDLRARFLLLRLSDTDHGGLAGHPARLARQSCSRTTLWVHPTLGVVSVVAWGARQASSACDGHGQTACRHRLRAQATAAAASAPSHPPGEPSLRRGRLGGSGWAQQAAILGAGGRGWAGEVRREKGRCARRGRVWPPTGIQSVCRASGEGRGASWPMSASSRSGRAGWEGQGRG